MLRHIQNHIELQRAFSFSMCLEHSSFIQQLYIEHLYQDRSWIKRWGIGWRVEPSRSKGRHVWRMWSEENLVYWIMEGGRDSQRRTRKLTRGWYESSLEKQAGPRSGAGFRGVDYVEHHFSLWLCLRTHDYLSHICLLKNSHCPSVCPFLSCILISSVSTGSFLLTLKLGKSSLILHTHNPSLTPHTPASTVFSPPLYGQICWKCSCLHLLTFHSPLPSFHLPHCVRTALRWPSVLHPVVLLLVNFLIALKEYVLFWTLTPLGFQGVSVSSFS